ncbi:class I SAM-dependent methyltransferase [Kitasatospora sp. NPDC093558]|uniref:class I SAM-dependent methyltransferase n=1 Tax=Kitasatospora sp. NPDC093558 TaxID=3155201 RepID=UPI00343DF91E
MHRPEPKSYWNTNVARHPDILRAVPAACRTALDVGCGDGLLAVKLAERAQRVVGVDKSPEMIAAARARADLEFLTGDFFELDLPRNEYDFICTVTTIHHMDFEAALTRMRELLRPGGVLVVVGMAKEKSPVDWALLLTVAPLFRVIKLLRRASAPEGMPVAKASLSYAEVRTAARRLLPGVRWRRHVLRRYSLTWTKPLH